jgi:hypothetical protein
MGFLIVTDRLSCGKLLYFIHTQTILMNMTTWKELVVPTLDRIEDDRIRITLHVEGMEIGVLYFEKAKRGYVNKPIIQKGWACVDAKVEGLYIYGGESITPKELVAWCQGLINEFIPNP